MFKTEYEFELPQGYVDSDGNLHKKGVMRLATAADEIFPLKDPRVTQNSAYIIIIILARVVTKLGTVDSINTATIERLFSRDLNYLQDMYQRINAPDASEQSVACPHCGGKFDLPPSFFLKG